jgi:hypothetical protein
MLCCAWLKVRISSEFFETLRRPPLITVPFYRSIDWLIEWLKFFIFFLHPVIDKRLTTISCSLSKNLAMTSDTNERDGDVEMQETQPRSSEENGRPSLPQTNLIRSSAPSTAERSEQDSQGSRKTSYTPHIQMLKPKNNAADQDVGDTSFGKGVGSIWYSVLLIDWLIWPTNWLIGRWFGWLIDWLIDCVY